ncbi:phage tail sheath subtilisin-like domain-containing protein [Pararobbsia silviterrae]|uniref:Tail sheath protein subtilisin-like domain-containing protein n=1 Tax=Pararobbsia silviterrae TaxID=1792498 RepID=A0A494X1T6_9BURK|nr:phage tail sheath subtilisin-like domain-containing protein [Pararobbsia silviterrae]RKP44677.1 hypothetical protein D7S86_26980 [Pararobbsia silviterrae]
MSYYFNGTEYITPTTVSAINDDAMTPAGASTSNLPCILGESEGGQPNVALVFSDPSVAQATLRGGELQQAVLRTFACSDDTGGPSQVVVFRVNPAVQSTLSLLDASGNDVIDLTSQDWGAWTSTIKTSIGAGSTQGLKVSIGVGSTITTADNIYGEPLTVQYTGEEETASMSITGTSLTLSAPTGTVVATVDLTTFSTIEELVDHINTLNDFVAVIASGYENDPSLNGLDFVTDVPILQAYTVEATLQALVDWFNGSAQTYVTAARGTNAGTLPTPIGYTYLTGGSDGETTTSSWNDTLTAMQAADVQWITPVSPTPTIWAMVDAHVQYMSTTGRMERRAICGTDLSTSDDAAIAYAKQINSNRTSLVNLGHYNYDLTGATDALVLWAPYISACALTGAFAASAPGTALTNKAMKFAGLERDLLNPTDTDALIQGGVIPLENTASGYKVTQSISTWLTDQKYDKVEQSVGFACDYIARTVRTNLDVLRGQKNGPLLMGRAISITDSTLRALAVPAPNGPEVIVGDADNPAYQNITASVSGTVLAVSFQCAPVLPANYIGITIYAVPYSGSASA